MTVPIWKVLGQLLPAAATPGNLYTVEIGRQSTVDAIVICNRGALTTVDVSVRIAGAADDPKQYLYYEFTLQANDTFIHRGPMPLFTFDEVWVNSVSGDVAFTIYGKEEFV